jgi:hypothetical protein
MLVALTMSLFISAEGADARLKSEWKFGGSLARLMSLPFSSAALSNNAVGNDIIGGMSIGGMSTADNSMLSGFAQQTSGLAQQTWAAQPAGGSLGGLFNRPGVVGGFSAGFLGAGVLGLVFGRGMTSELTGAASVLGLIFQLTLILMLARLIWTWWRADRSAAFAEMSPRQLADAYGRLRNEALPDVDCVADAGLDVNNGAFVKKD